MENTSLIALSRLGALRRKMDVVANNIANMNTTGFKGEKMMFVEHVVKSVGGERIGGDRIAFVRDIATVRDFGEGPLKKTGNPLDVAIRGDGYFVVESDVGKFYTRSGKFRMNEEGQLVTQQGYAVLSDGGQPFFFSPEDKRIDIGRDGTITTENGTLGKLRVVRFEDQQSLRAVEGGLFTTDEAPTAVERPDVAQFMLEGSNVEPIREMARMINVQRTYASVQKLIDKEDERMRNMIDTLVNQA